MPNKVSNTTAPAKIVTDIFVITYAKIDTIDKYILAEEEKRFSKNSGIVVTPLFL